VSSPIVRGANPTGLEKCAQPMAIEAKDLAGSDHQKRSLRLPDAHARGDEDRSNPWEN